MIACRVRKLNFDYNLMIILVELNMKHASTTRNLNVKSKYSKYWLYLVVYILE